ncbi:MAG: UDP-N-acetylmuramyl-tripeptide synthetase [Trueperaceae bacterium]|nr:UDP-N-acetylmuramyl-tripeptide synthetase [Trueperaceae bacterium]
MSAGSGVWHLRDLLRDALGVLRDDVDDVRVRGVAQSHDRVVPGSLFVARVGRRSDAHDLVPAAIERGAVCVVGTRSGSTHVAGGVPYVHVADDRWATSALAATFHDHPSRALTTIGVTGTDGKSTTATLLHHILQGERDDAVAGLLATVGVRIGRSHETLPGHFTTPEATEVHAVLARMRAAGVTLAVVESSSHGFALGRLEHVAYAIGVWTTFTPEHLDDHGTLEAYLEAKRTLVRRAPISILNRDDPAFAAFAAVARSLRSYGVHPDADVRAERIDVRATGITFDLVVRDHDPITVALPMVGTFNVHNALAALAAADLVGVPWHDGVRSLATFPGVPGRMQLVSKEPFGVIVDFAHTAPALAKALAAIATAAGGRKIVVIGAAGERDPGKREPIARAAVAGADLAVFTEEDHRSEDLGAILATMAASAVAAGARPGVDFLVIPDRREAIAAAIASARPGDVVLLCGKGHERTLERTDEVLTWDEASEVTAAVRRARAATPEGA